MKLIPLKWPTKKEHSEYMRMRQQQNRKKGMTKAEAWAFEFLRTRTKYKWTFQASWGYRLFDFWCDEIGCAVEIDGKEHHKGRDAAKDTWHWHRSRIKVLRIPNFDEKRMLEVIAEVNGMDKWKERRAGLNIKALKKQTHRLRMEIQTGQRSFDL